MKRIKKHFSAGNVIALIALFVALGGSAYAGAKIGTGQLKNGAVTGSKVSSKFIQWGFVDDNGNKVSGRGLVSSSRIDTGSYLVTFKNPVDKCAINATSDRLVPSHMVVVATKNSGASGDVVNLRQVEVTIGDPDGLDVDGDFRISVLC